MSLIKRDAGFSIIELIITMMVVATVLAIGAPSFQAVMNKSVAVSDVNDLLASLAFARSEAIKRSNRVVICKTEDSVNCAVTSTGEGWEKGWIIFVDTNNNGILDGAELTLRVHAPLSTKLNRNNENIRTLTGNTPFRNYVSYTSDGAARFTTGGFQAGKFEFGLLCIKSKNQKYLVYKISISDTGRARIKKEQPEIKVDWCPN